MASSSQQAQLETSLTTFPVPLPADQRGAQEQTEPDSGEEIAPFHMQTVRSILGWMTPYEQVEFLRRKRDLKRWELFRDSLMRRWSNLNVICGLIMGAVSTIVFADFPLSRASFTLGIISLLSSLIAIGFGVGLIYVLGDVRGSSLVIIDDRYPRLHLFALSIPEVWAFISFGTFFADVSVIVWEADDKGWTVKAGTTVAAVAFVAHLVAFGFLFREQDTTEFLIPDEPVFVSDEPKANTRPSYSQSQLQATQVTLVPASTDFSSKKGKVTSLDSVPDPNPNTNSGHARMPEASHVLRSSQTLVASPGALGQASFRVPPLRASTAPETFNVDVEMQRSMDAFVLRPTGEVVPTVGGSTE